MNSSELLQKSLQEQAAAFGLDTFGLAPLPLPRQSGQRYRNWLSSGFHAGMTWAETHAPLREDPMCLLPEAKSVAVFAFPYPSVLPHSSPTMLARYALVPDYHSFLRSRLEKILAGLIHTVPGLQGRVCVDTAPLQERSAAITAGIGWIGRNGCLVTERHGSWVFLGSIVLNLPVLELATSMPSRCGACRLCLDSCLTGALREDGLVDCRRCLSWLTVENRGTIPLLLAESMRGMVLGCDRCQESCPWNATKIVREHGVPGSSLERTEKASPLLPPHLPSPTPQSDSSSSPNSACLANRFSPNSACLANEVSPNSACLTNGVSDLSEDPEICRCGDHGRECSGFEMPQIPELLSLDVVSLPYLSSKSFLRQYQYTALRRPGLAGMLRNLIASPSCPLPLEAVRHAAERFPLVHDQWALLFP